MGDLISRSTLLKEIETWGGCVEALYEYIANMPTSYDISRVVVQLEGLKECITNHYENGIYTHTSTNYDIDTLNKAIEIVKQGGVSDDVCEWKIDGVYLRSPHNRPFVTCIADDEDYRYNFCPVCGKKIKAVE